MQNTKKIKAISEKLLFISDNEKSVRIIEEGIEYIGGNKEYFLESMHIIINSQIKELIKVYISEDLNLHTEIDHKLNKNYLNLQIKGEKNLLVGDFKLAIQSLILMSETAKFLNDNFTYARGKECIGIAQFIEEYKKINDIKDLKFNIEVEANLEIAAQSYKKAKFYELYIETIFKLAFYYKLFDTKIKNFLDIMKRIYEELECLAQHISPLFKFTSLLKFSDLFIKMNMKRKASFYLYLALIPCFENQDISNMLPYIFKEINSRFNVYDIYNDKIDNPSHFNEVHKKLTKSNWKHISFHSCLTTDDKTAMQETNKKRIDKELKLFVTNRLEEIKKYSLSPLWEPIQYNLYLNYINYCKSDMKMKLAYSLSYIQTMTNFISLNDQRSLMNKIMVDSSLLQEKIFLNLNKLPIVIKLIPYCSDIKFDIIKNVQKLDLPENNDKESKEPQTPTSNGTGNIFLYNPWEKEIGINYYWTTNSFQKVFLEVYNPLSVELKLDKIVLLFDGCKPFSFPSKYNY